MRKIICTSQLFIVLISFCLASNQSFSQTHFKCNSDSLYDDVMQNDSIFFEDENLMNLKIRDAFLNNTILSAKSGSSLLPEYTIPVVVHVIYDVDDQNNLALNISYAQIESQIAKLNSIFASIGTPTRYDSDIKFCLAKSPSNFFPTAEPGVIR